jgi:hypothetical protein
VAADTQSAIRFWYNPKEQGLSGIRAARKNTLILDFYGTIKRLQIGCIALLRGNATIMLNSRRHKTVTKSFEELTFKEQSHAMNRNALEFRKQLTAHVRKARAEGHCTKTVLERRRRLLERLFGHYASEIETPAISISR